ncbi:hypothetical protein Tco_0202437 [Tanacetum coccineum]
MDNEGFYAKTHLKLLFSFGLFLCPLCNRAVENSDHILFSCSMVRKVWRRLLTWWELDVSSFHSYNVEDEMVKNAASKLGCLVLKTPFTYLGTKVEGNMSRKQAWKEVVDKVLSSLSRWKMKLLSIGGRLTLLKSVLGSMPIIFHMSIFKVPLSILKSLESIRSRFFNGQDPKDKGPNSKG